MRSTRKLIKKERKTSHLLTHAVPNCLLTVLHEDQEGAGEDLEHLSRHHSGGGQVAGAVLLQGAGVAHGEHQRGGLQHQHPQRHILQPRGV